MKTMNAETSGMKWGKLPNGDYELCTPKVLVRVVPMGFQHRYFTMYFDGRPQGTKKKLGDAKAEMEAMFTNGSVL